MAVTTPFRVLAGLLVVAALATAESLALDELLARMQKSEQTRSEALTRYSATRRYVLTNSRFSKRAEMLARVSYRQPGEKQFDVISESGPGVLRNRVLRKMMESEREGSRPGRLALTFINATNYKLRVLRTEALDGRSAHVLELEPKSGSPYLIRGHAWIDAEDFAVVRLEGQLAKNPSFWTRETKFIARYAKFGDFWLPVSNYSSTDARFFGTTEVVMDCFDYQLQPASASLSSR